MSIEDWEAWRHSQREVIQVYGHEGSNQKSIRIAATYPAVVLGASDSLVSRVPPHRHRAHERS
jgi:hypothetical protein